MNYLTSTFSIGVHTLIFHTNFQIELQKHFPYLEVNYSTNPTTWNTDKKQARKYLCSQKWCHKNPYIFPIGEWLIGESKVTLISLTILITTLMLVFPSLHSRWEETNHEEDRGTNRGNKPKTIWHRRRYLFKNYRKSTSNPICLHSPWGHHLLYKRKNNEHF